ncbi:MAG: protein-L-isoaspartate(D-aspartate) O-methyltransferase [Candidatus Woesearchaeota archaeon]
MSFEEEKEFLVKGWKDSGILKNKLILEAFMKIKREDFVLPEYRELAYEDTPLPIPADQTISQPTTLIIFLEALELEEKCKILEIGAGSGYNAALLGAACKKGKVISTEIIEELVKYAKDNIKKTGLKNVKIVRWDGTKGYKKEEPYDRIICTAAVPEIPQEWIDQLKIDGIIVAPVGPKYGQTLIKLRKTKEGIKISEMGGFIFVPARGKYGYPV